MNADAVKQLVLAVRLDLKCLSNPFTFALGKWYPTLRDVVEANIGQWITERSLRDLAIAYDAWLDLWPDSWDGDKFPAVLDDFIPFAQDVQKLLALGKISTALEVANVVRNTPHVKYGCTRQNHILSHFHNLMEDLKAEHEQALEDLENHEVDERLEELRHNRGC